MRLEKCPSDEQLSHFAIGELAISDHEAIESHLDACGDCQDTLVGLDGTSRATVANLLSPPSEAPGDIDPELAELVQKAKAVWRESGTSAGRLSSTRAAEALPDPFPAGSEFGSYRVEETLGAGNMGRVVRAYHQTMKRDVALKFISPELVNSPEARLRFQREIEAAAKLQHSNLVVAHDAGEFEGQHFLAMEYVRGRDLRQIVKRAGRLSLDQSLRYVLQAARGLEHAHQLGVIHRDVKPANLMLDDQGTVKVLDLGLARLLDSNEEDDGKSKSEVDISRTGLLLGTVAFMSPEQCAGSKQIDHRTDVYSLGCTLFYLLVGRNVFKADSAVAMLRAHAENEPPSLLDSGTNCPPEVNSLFQEMLSKDPGERPQTMSAVVERIEQLLAGDGSAIANIELPNDQVKKAANPVWWGSIGAAIVVFALYLSGVFSPASTTPPNNAPPNNTANRTVPRDGHPQKPELALVRIAPGKFMMGTAKDVPNVRADEKPQHEVQISRPFLIGKFEVTIDEFREVMGDEFKQPLGGGDTSSKEADGMIPISGVSWLDAIRFCNRLSELHGLTPFYRVSGEQVSVAPGSNGYRLPTEAEWEYACRGGSNSKWHFGDDPEKLDEFAWFEKNSAGQLHKVGTKKPNAFGLHDMHGNVPEWCWDRYDPDYYNESEAIDPPGSSRGVQRVFRGGGATNRDMQTRAAVRNPLGMRYGFFNSVGFRVARSVE